MKAVGFCGGSLRLFFLGVKKMEIQIVKKEQVLGQEFTVYGDFENPLFLAKDVAAWIDYAKTSQGFYDVSNMLKSVDDDEKIKIFTTTNNLRSGCEQWFLTENGLYEVLMLSRKPIAKDFKKEVKRILHEIRTTGGYTVPRSYAEALQIAADQAKRIEEQNKQIAIMQPKAVVYDEFVERERFCNFRDGANYLHISQSDLMNLLKSRYIYKNSAGEYRHYSEYSQYFALRPFTLGNKTKQQLMFTIKGLEFFKNKINSAKKVEA